MTGTFEGGENIEEELTTQEQIISRLKYAIEEKTVGKNTINLYRQLTEPEHKNGIWLQSDVAYDHIVSDEVIFSEEWDYSKNATAKTFTRGCYCNNYMYLWNISGEEKRLYRYSIKTDTYEFLINMPKAFKMGDTIGDYIYMFGIADGTAYTYKYDTIQNKFTELPAPPSSVLSYMAYNGKCIAVDKCIYIFGAGGNYNTSFKFDTETETYASISFTSRSASAATPVYYDGKIYVFGLYYSNNSNYVYVYDIKTDSTTALDRMPYSFVKGIVVAHGGTVYLIGSDTDAGYNPNGTAFYKYDINTATYTQLDNLAYQASGAYKTYSDTPYGIYIMGDEFQPNRVRHLKFPSTVNFKDKSIVIDVKENIYKTNLINIDVDNGLPYYFKDVYYYTEANGLDNSIPTYYGDGLNWIKFKN